MNGIHTVRSRTEEEAVEWFLRVERSEPSVEELMHWQQWMDQSAAHRSAYESVLRTWRALDGIEAPPWPSDTDVQADRSDEPLRKRLSGMKWSAWAAAACIAAAAGTVLLMHWDFRIAPDPDYHSDIRTDVAEHRQLRLPDGSRLQVGASTRIKVYFSAQQRSIRLLSGEAFFTVEKDARPFVVEAGTSRVTAVGTAFNVRHYENVVTVEVAAGQVRLESGGAQGTAALLNPGQEAMLDGRGTLQAVRAVSTEQIAGWRSGHHRYIDTPLSVVVADLNRYASRRVEIEDPATGALRVTATFFSDDWEGWLESLEKAVPSLGVVHREEAVRIVKR